MVSQRGLAVIAYFFGIIGGIVIYLISEKKDKFLRFHAKQSILYNIVAGIIGAVIWGATFAAGFTNPAMFVVGMVVTAIYSIILFIIWIVLMVKAYDGKKWKLPVIGDWAE